MTITNNVTQETLEVSEKQVKEILEWILFASSNGTYYVCMNSLPTSTDKSYFIVSESYMKSGKDSAFAKELLEAKVNQLTLKLDEIHDLSK